MEVLKNSGQAGVIVIHVDDNQAIKVKFKYRIDISVIYSTEVQESNASQSSTQKSRKSVFRGANDSYDIETMIILEETITDRTNVPVVDTTLNDDCTFSLSNKSGIEDIHQNRNAIAKTTRGEEPKSVVQKHDRVFSDSEDEHGHSKIDIKEDITDDDDERHSISIFRHYMDSFGHKANKSLAEADFGNSETNCKEELPESLSNISNEVTCSNSQEKTSGNSMKTKNQHLELETFICVEKSETVDDFPCDICQKRFHSDQELLDHQLAVAEKLKCSICKQECMSKAHLLLHDYLAHASLRNTYKTSDSECPLCSETLLNDSDLIIHIKNRHTKEGIHQCCACHKVFEIGTAFNLHLDHFRINNSCSETEKPAARSQRSKGGEYSGQQMKPETVVQKSKKCIQRRMKKNVKAGSEAAKAHPARAEKPSKLGTSLQSSKLCAKLKKQRKTKIITKKSLASPSSVEELEPGVESVIIKVEGEQNPLWNTMWKCKFCERVFKDKYEFINHRRPLTVVKTCKVCGARAKSKAEYLIHQHERHPGDDNIANYILSNKAPKCPLCEEDLSPSEILSHVMLKHTGEFPYVCCVCGTPLETYESWISHGKTHLAGCDENKSPASRLIASLFITNDKDCTNRVCKLCKENFQSEKDFLHHHRNETKKKMCDICKTATYTEAGSIVHRYLSHSLPSGEDCLSLDAFPSIDTAGRLWEEDSQSNDEGSENVKCPCCADSFPINDLLSHIMACHTQEAAFKCCACKCLVSCMDHYLEHCNFHLGKTIYGPKAIRCLQCDLRFESRLSLGAHKKLHKAICPYCHMEFSSDIFLDVHLQNVHPNEMAACSYCGKLFSSSIKLAGHERHHYFARPTQCSLCGKTMDKRNMKRHVRLAHPKLGEDHNGVVCNICGKTFLERHYMERHKLFHANAKDCSYECEVCKKKFKSSVHLQCHAKIHLQERKLHVCHICGKACTKSCNLKAHLRTHTSSNVKAFRCLLCDKGFNYNQSLLSHIEKKHKDGNSCLSANSQPM